VPLALVFFCDLYYKKDKNYLARVAADPPPAEHRLAAFMTMEERGAWLAWETGGGEVFPFRPQIPP